MCILTAFSGTHRPVRLEHPTRHVVQKMTNTEWAQAIADKSGGVAGEDVFADRLAYVHSRLQSMLPVRDNAQWLRNRIDRDDSWRLREMFSTDGNGGPYGRAVHS